VLFSVIVPFYNSATTIAQTLESLLNQTNPHFEAILVNDGSTDNSLNLARELTGKDSRFSIITSTNFGPGYARNLALDRAQGDYIVFLDADDYVPTTFFSALTKLTSNYSPDVLIFLYRALRGGVELSEKLPRALSRMFGRRNVVHLKEAFPARHLWRVNPAVWNKSFRRDFLAKNQISFDPAFTLGEDDVEFTFRSLMAAKSVTLSREVLYFYRTGVTGTLSGQKYPLALASIRAIQALLKTKNLEAKWRNALYDQIGQFALQALSERPRLASLRDLAEIAKTRESTDAIPRSSIYNAIMRGVSRRLWGFLTPPLRKR
jgi:glycosyltransferase involved in cell wall biosynthesis